VELDKIEVQTDTLARQIESRGRVAIHDRALLKGRDYDSAVELRE